MSNIWFYALIPLSALITAVSQILLKLSANRKHDSAWREYLNPLVIIAYALFFGVLLLNVWIFTRVDYRFGVVINTLAMLLVMMLSKLILHERFTKRKCVGIGLLTAGIVVYTML